MSEIVVAPQAGATNQAEERIAVASHWQLVWWRFRKHRLAVCASLVIIAFYVVVLVPDFFAYSQDGLGDSTRSALPPQPIHFFHQGRFSPFVYGVKGVRDPATFRFTYQADPEQIVPVRFFGRGYRYKLLGLIPLDRHLLGVDDPEMVKQLALLGTDKLGRDLWSRLMFATRISLTIGLASVVLSLLLGVLFGGISGYFGGAIDSAIQRTIEIVRSIPTIPLWMGLAAGLPRDWSVLQVYFAITLIISLIGWTELARVVRGRFLALREEDFVLAARLVGCSQFRIIFQHMVPSFMSHIIAATTLALPAMIIVETALSFLGLGMRPPAISWGVLLRDAQSLESVALSPWLLIPAVPVTVVILAFNFVGDGLRDAADPYGM